jgi:predicted nucleic acid-binding protein
MKIVLNTSPLIFLTRLELLEIFLSQAGEYFTPQAVFDEIQAKDDGVSLSLKTIFDNRKIEIRSIQMSILANSLNQRLGRGESEAMTLALELNANYIILDDFAARREANRLGLQVKGTLAIIKRLHQEGQITIDSLEELYQRIISIGFRVKRSVFDDIFA